ncbi:hypothetical protein QF002_007442 [Paraburkholderia youngii]
MKPSLTRSGKQPIYDAELRVRDDRQRTGKRMVPMRAHIRARKLDDFPDYIRHSGEEFVFLLEDKPELRFENGSVFRLDQGDSLYFESAVGHVYPSVGKEEAEVLVCCVDTDSH